MIPRRFKRKKFFVMYVRKEVRNWTDRRDGRNSYLDFKFPAKIIGWQIYIGNYFDYHVCVSSVHCPVFICLGITPRLLGSTPGVDPG